jgi:hypothetical protein
MFRSPDPPTFAAAMTAGTYSPTPGRLIFGLLLVLLNLTFVHSVSAQGSEDFTNLPTVNATAYQTRSWTGTNGVTWTAEGARTDQNLTARAICFGTTGNRWVTSPSYANGMGTLTFNYVRGFTGTNARSLQVWVNGAQVGPTIAVSATSDAVVAHSQVINIAGNVVLEIRSTGAAQVIVDDILWTPFNPGPTASFATATSSVGENAGTVVVGLNIAPATLAAGTLVITVANGAGVTYGGDYTSTPAVAAGTITLNVPAGATTASFSIAIVDDLATEANETITFTITGGTAAAIGLPGSHVLTIVDDDLTPTVNFSTLSIAVLENAGVQTFQISIAPAAPVAGSLTIQVINGPGAVYGFGNDYLTNPAVIAGNITVNIAAGATAASFTATVLDDALVELTETVTFTLVAVPAGFALGGNNSAILTIGDNDSPPTVLAPGDLVVVGVNANNQTCSGLIGEDEISFFCFKPIVPGTAIILTDNGYERCFPGMWGNSEGTVRMVRTGMAIPAGQVITFRLSTNWGAANVISIAPDNGWSCTSLNGNTSVNLNSGGDQIFFMQGGTWNAGIAGSHNATYDGTVLFAFSTNPNPPWTASCSVSPNLRSNLPPGMECFSMAPTLATDYNKYVGPITAASQRNWIIRVDDPANWNTYPSCTDYSAQGYNWLTAPILPITVASFQPGRWTGAISTDWFDCKNWDDARVPTLITDVLIDETALRNCAVGIAGGNWPAGTGECSSLLITNSGFSRNLSIEANSTLNVDGPVLVERTGGTGVLNLNILGGGTLNATELLVQSVSTEARLNCVTATSLASFESHVTIGVGGTVALGVTGGTVQLGGNWTNLSGEAAFQETVGLIRFNGANDQFIMTPGFEEVFYNLHVSKSGGSLILASPAAVRGTLDLQTGLVTTTATQLLTMRAGSAAINASDLSFVNGPMQKIGLTDFIFPVGKNTSHRPCGVRNLAGTVTDAFRAEYFPISPITTFNNVLEPTLDHISDCEYWMIDRSSGTPNATVELSWDTPESCTVTDLAALRVARFNGMQWLDRGNGVTTGTTVTGTITTAAVQNLFSPWTLASINGSNPLPITLLHFTARAEGSSVRLDWATGSELNNERFTVERSANGLDFIPVAEMEGAGTSNVLHSYHTFDRSPMRGMNYYRLRQTDHDGTATLSSVEAVHFAGEGRELAVNSTDGFVQAWHTFSGGSMHQVLDLTGRIVLEGITVQDGRSAITMAGLPAGTYLFRVQGDGRSETVRFVHP